MERAMGIEPTSKDWEGVDESGSLVPQLKGNTRVSELIPRGHGPGYEQPGEGYLYSRIPTLLSRAMMFPRR